MTADLRFRRGMVIGALCLCGGVVWASRAWIGGNLNLLGDPWRGSSEPPSSAHGVVVAELFTSEGCSSCPPADEVLTRLVREPLDGTVVLGLSEHVDYWNHLGWRDPFSSAALSSRQAVYADQVFRGVSIYTPQLVVDGQLEAVGSNVSGVRRAIAAASRVQKADIEVSASAEAGHVSVRARIDLASAIAVREPADVIVALTQDRLANDVARGENRGRKLVHSAVVRSLTTIGSVQPSMRIFEETTTIPIGAGWNLHDVKIIGLLQERRSRRIVGAGSARVGAATGSQSVS